MSLSALNAAVSGAQAEDFRIQIIANNIANASTTGFKASAITTSDLFYTNLKQAGIQENQNNSNRPVGIAVGAGSHIEATQRILTQGQFRTTGQPLDMAISGVGYFAISIPGYRNDRAFTRDGSFEVDENGNITTARGEPLFDPLTLPAGVTVSSLTVAKDGTITGLDANNNQVPVGQIQLYTFPNERGLEAMGSNALVETDGSGEAVTVADQTNMILSKTLEMSNVSTIEELTRLIAAQRNYEMAVRVIKTVDEMQKEMISIKS